MNTPSSSTYPELREAGKSLTNKIYQSPLIKEYNVMKAAKKLTLPVQDNTLIFQGESHVNALMDFHFHEYRQAGKTLISCCEPDELKLTPLETEVLRAHQASRTSLFQTGEVNSRTHQIELKDLLAPERAPFFLTDHGFSKSISHYRISLLIFARLIHVPPFYMTTGFVFPFHAEKKHALLQEYRLRMKSAPPADRKERKFVLFYQRYRQDGIQDQVYQDVAPSKHPA